MLLFNASKHFCSKTRDAFHHATSSTPLCLPLSTSIIGGISRAQGSSMYVSLCLYSLVVEPGDSQKAWPASYISHHVDY